MEQKLTYKSNNQDLVGVLNKVNDTDEIVVICHARTSSKDSRPTKRLSESMTEIGLNNFRFDFVACGESEGKNIDYNVSNMVQNLDDTLDYLKSKGFNRFILIGCSMGARIVSLVKHEKFNIEKIILWYGAFDYGRGILNLPGKQEKIAKKQGFYQGENGWKFPYEYFKDERRYKAYKNLYNWNVPKLFIHGTRDPYVNVSSSINISKKALNSKLVLIKNGDHGFHDIENMNEAIQETERFILNRGR